MTDFFTPDPRQDMKNRDPYEVNSHVKVQFHDIIAEPKQFHSCDCVWDTVTCCYDCSFIACYNIWAVCCGCCLACEYGIEFGCLAFAHVWQISPFLKWFELCLWPCRCCYKLCVSCAIDPWFEACGYVFSHFEDKPTSDLKWTSE